jgi:enhancer of polycomb-like protein
MSYAILKFSETVEECRRYGLANRSYTMDERDAAWLEQWNQLARGEGTSNGSTRKSKAKIPEGAEDEQLVVIDEDWFELCMGLFETFSSMHFPYLHVVCTFTSHDSPSDTQQSQDYPSWSFFDPLFQQPYVPSLFASSLVPEGLPPTNELVVMARGIYPHWLERKTERRGRSIIPDVNLEESDEGNVYVCFRRREVKPIRKTRRMETTSIDKLTRLSSEFQSAIALTKKTMEREDLKADTCGEDQTIWNFRARMVSITSKYPDLRNADDDKWLIDKERVKKPKAIDSLPPIKIPRIPASTPQVFDELLDLGQPTVHPRVRYEDIQNKIEQEVAKRKERNLLGWDDVTDVRLCF